MELPLPLTRDVVLIGGGHTHALVLRAWGMKPVPGVRLTVINPGPTAPYSGMLPGFVAGHYARDALDIDLVRLARFAGARLILGAATRLDAAARTVTVPGWPAIAYDYCSVDIGVTSAMPDLPGFAEHGIPAKPLGPFSKAWAAFVARDAAADVAVLGGGVAGVELALAMAHALRSARRPARLHLVDRGLALTAVDARTKRRLMQALADHDVTVLEQTRVTRVTGSAVLCADGTGIPADFVTGAAGARPHGWLADSGLDLHNGFITVDRHLQSSDPAVFAVGDCAHTGFDPRPKAGVYAVRQAPVLLQNVTARCTGGTPRVYRPQADYLKLIALGDKVALAQRMGCSVAGPLMWRWKDRIDRRFMSRFRTLPAMPVKPLPTLRATGVDESLGDRPLCGGCGSKVGRDILHASIGLQANARPDAGHPPGDDGDDAALLHVGGARQVLSTDHLRAFVEDPVLMTRIAAVHALGDIWAMGAKPQAALLSVILPPLSGALQQRTLSEIYFSAQQVMGDAGARIIGGHSTTGAELTIGFTVTGLCDAAPITLAGARAGDALLLTRPLGSGVLLAAGMAGKAGGADMAAAYEIMQQTQSLSSAILAPAAHAMTDVTGFGLIGHLSGICQASGVGAALDLPSVPLMQGAYALAADGVRSTLWPENKALAPNLPPGPAAGLMVDPQTSGGLLAAVPAAQADGLLAELLQSGHQAARIGSFIPGPPRVVFY